MTAAATPMTPQRTHHGSMPTRLVVATASVMVPPMSWSRSGKVEDGAAPPPEIRQICIAGRSRTRSRRETAGVRKQYHFRPGPTGLMAWDVDRLVALAHDLPTESVSLREIAELDSAYWFDHGYEPTVRAVVEHLRLVQRVDLSYPIVLDPGGRVMDGMHRVARALLDGALTISAKRLRELPEPDYLGCHPDDLPY